MREKRKNDQIKTIIVTSMFSALTVLLPLVEAADRDAGGAATAQLPAEDPAECNCLQSRISS